MSDDDVLERLRAFLEDPAKMPNLGKLILDAADEIEKLRERIAIMEEGR